MNPSQRADDIPTKEQPRYENKNHVISKRQALPLPSQCYPMNLPSYKYNATLLHEYAVPHAIEPIDANPDEPFLTAPGISLENIDAPDSTEEVNSPSYSYNVENDSPNYTFEISDPEQLGDQDFWTKFFSQQLEISPLNNGDQNIVIEVLPPGDEPNAIYPACNATESSTSAESTEIEATLPTETPECDTTPNDVESFSSETVTISPIEIETTAVSAVETIEAVTHAAEKSELSTESLEIDESAGNEDTSVPSDLKKTPKKFKHLFEIRVIKALKRISEKLDQMENCDNDVECDRSCDNSDKTCKNDDADQPETTIVSSPVDPTQTSASKPKSKIQNALAALLETVKALQSCNDNDMIRRFKKHNC